jgi:hypothetical protein
MSRTMFLTALHFFADKTKCQEYSAIWRTSQTIELTYKYSDKNLRTQYLQSKTFKKNYDYDDLLPFCEVDTSVIN